MVCTVNHCVHTFFPFGDLALISDRGIYRDAIHYTDPNLTPDITGKAFYAIPATYITTTTAFLNNFVSAAVYVCVAFAIGDDSNIPPGSGTYSPPPINCFSDIESGMSALIYGLMTYLLCITTGNNGLGISPARDLGPRCVAWWVGYGRATFSTGWWAIGPIAGGLTGTLFGALVYDVLIFVGGESPVNYRWPKTSDIKLRAKLGKDKAKQNLQELPL
jgi:aquaglyceroporin related protein